VVLGNPPWDALRLLEKEFFATTRPDIAAAPTSSERKALISLLAVEDPPLYFSFEKEARRFEGTNALAVHTSRYPLCGVGRVNLFALFAELARQLLGPRGRSGQILPSGIVSDDSTKLYFQRIVETGQLVSFYDFENRDGVFSAVHRSFKFGLLTLANPSQPARSIDFVFFASQASQLSDSARHLRLSREDIAVLNPATKTCPIFRTRRDAELTLRTYQKMPVLTSANWGAVPTFPLDKGRASASFVTAKRPGYAPLYEGKYFHQYNHRWSTYSSGIESEVDVSDVDLADPHVLLQPRYWFPANAATDRFSKKWGRPWALVWRDIARSTDERTMIATIIPSLAVAHTATLLFVAPEFVPSIHCLVANLNSMAFDFVTRQKVGGIHLSAFILEQLPVVPQSEYSQVLAGDVASLSEWIRPRFLELTHTAWDMEAFASDIGYAGPPFRWDPERRAILRAELDAAFFHLYGLDADDTAYILDTFPVLRDKEVRQFGEYRTRRLVLERYAALATAIATRTPYTSPLSPPPASPLAAHQPQAQEVKQ
jgi:hypothetical protein